MRSIIRYIFTITILFGNTFILAQEHPGPKVGVVLSGGGAKGYAHIGALKVIEKAGVKIDYIGGTSIGAIVGALYASGYTADELEKIMYSLDLNSMILNDKSRSELPFFDKTYREKYILELPFDNFKLGFPNALSTGQGTAEELTYLFRHVHNINDFNELPIPFVCVATKLSDGESVVFHEGYLPQVVMASGAYPTLFEPVRIKGQLYTDGGVKNNYPVQEVLDLGADYIIGIDIQEGLMDQDNLNSATKIIEQIISYNIIEKSKEQSKKVNLSIEPDMQGFSVTSFDKKQEIINAGTKAAENVWDQLTEIAKEQGNPVLDQSSIETDEYSLITNLTINGLDTYNKSYVIGKLGIIPPQLVSFKTIRKGINALYSTGNFNKVYYRIKDSDDGHKKLSIYLQEKPNHQFLKFGLHYDDLFKTGLLVNFTAKHVIFENSILSTDVILGDFPRYEFNYYIDNSIFPSLGFNFGYKQFNSDAKTSNFTENYNDISLNYNFDEFINQIYIQSTLFDKYAIGGGLEHQYLSIKTKNLPSTDPNRVIEDSYFLKLFGYIKADNLNNPNYPSKGLKLNTNFKYIFGSNSPDFSETSYLTTKIQINQALTNWLSIQGFGEFGTFFSYYPTASQKFSLGGFVEQNFLNYSRFYGLPYFSASGDNLLLIGGKLQTKILRNHYISTFANFANITPDFNDLQILKYRYSGFGIGYGYDSPLGPINGLWTYSPLTKSGLFNVSLGFWF